MNFIVWLVIGACAGSLAAITLQPGIPGIGQSGASRHSLGLVANVVLGVAGAVVGGMLVSPRDLANAALTVDSFAMSLVGAVVVLVIANAVRKYALR